MVKGDTERKIDTERHQEKCSSDINSPHAVPNEKPVACPDFLCIAWADSALS